MRWINCLKIVALAMGFSGILPSAFAGTVITANLPANTAIVNISATQDGALAYNGNQSLWYEPFYTGGAAQLLEYTVQPGTYDFRVINPADAAVMYPELSPAQTNQIFTAWTYNSPWVTDYLVFDSSAASNISIPQLFDGAFSNTNGTWYTYGNAAAAYSAAVTGGFYDLIRSGPAGRSGTAFNTSYAFAATTTLILVVPDYDLVDNNGGVSVLISPAAPVPVLSIVPGAGVVTLLWPTNAAGYKLNQTTNLLPAAWSVVTNLPAVINTNFSETLPVDSTSRFFRLQNP